jgi:hypothetical protein
MDKKNRTINAYIYLSTPLSARFAFIFFLPSFHSPEPRFEHISIRTTAAKGWNCHFASLLLFFLSGFLLCNSICCRFSPCLIKTEKTFGLKKKCISSISKTQFKGIIHVNDEQKPII